MDLAKDLLKELNEIEHTREFRTPGAKNKPKVPPGTTPTPPTPSGGQASPQPTPTASPQAPPPTPTPTPAQPQMTAQAAAQTLLTKTEMEIWDYVETTSKAYHQMAMQKGFKEIIQNREEIWPDIKSETYIDRFLTQYAQKHDLFSFPKGLKTSGFKILDKVSTVSTRDSADDSDIPLAVGTVSGAPKKGAAATDLLFDYSPPDLENAKTSYSKLKMNTIKLESISNIIDSKPGALRPMTCFVATLAHIFPSMFLAIQVNCWSSSVMSINATYTTDDFVGALRIGSAFLDTGSPAIAPIKWIKLINELISDYFEKNNYLESVLKDKNEINQEWNLVRKMFKLLIISLGPQAN